MLALIEPPLGHPVVALCWGDPAALGLQGWSLLMLHQTTDEVNFEMDQFLNLVLGLGSYKVGQPAPSSLFSPPGCAVLKYSS